MLLGRLATSRLALPAIVALAIVGRLAVQLVLGFYQHPETWEYDDLARNVVSGHGYTIEHLGTVYRAFALPGYTAILVALYALFGISAIPVGILQAVLGGILTWAVHDIAVRGRLGRPVALVAALLAATHPGLLIYSAKIHALNFDAILASLLVLVLLEIGQRPSVRSGIALGLAAAAATLERPTYVPIVISGLAYVALIHGRVRVAAAHAAFAAMIVALAVLPWVVRNNVEVGQPVLTTTGGEVLWRGNNPAASGGAVTAAGVPILDAAPTFRDAIWGKPETEQNDAFFAAAATYMSADPLATVGRTIAKLEMFWWFGPTTGTLYPATWLPVYAAYYLVMVGCAAVGAFWIVRRGNVAVAFHVMMLSLFVSAQQALTYVEGRHRWGIEPLIGVLAAAGIVAVLERAQSRAGSATPVAPATADR